MHVEFLNGTSQQKQWFKEALAWSWWAVDLFPPSSYRGLSSTAFLGIPVLEQEAFMGASTADVTVEWANSVSHGDSLAETSYPGGTPGLIRAAMVIDEDLAEDRMKETIIHECAHILQAEMTTGDRNALRALFGNRPWNTGAWADQAQEAAAETLKDLFAWSEQRESLNVTNFRLSQSNLEAFVKRYYAKDPVSDSLGELVVPKYSGVGSSADDNPPHGIEFGGFTALAQTPNEVTSNWQRFEATVAVDHLLGHDGLGVVVPAATDWSTVQRYNMGYSMVDGDGNVLRAAPSWWGDVPALMGGGTPSPGQWLTNTDASPTTQQYDRTYVKKPITITARVAFQTAGPPGTAPITPTGFSGFRLSHSWVPLYGEGLPEWPYTDKGNMQIGNALLGNRRSTNIVRGMLARMFSNPTPEVLPTPN